MWVRSSTWHLWKKKCTWLINKWKIFSTSYQKMQKMTQLGNNLAEFFKGHYSCGAGGRLLNVLVCKAGNDSIRDLPFSLLPQRWLRLREFNEFISCPTAYEWQSWDGTTGENAHQCLCSHSEPQLAHTGQMLFWAFGKTRVWVLHVPYALVKTLYRIGWDLVIGLGHHGGFGDIGCFSEKLHSGVSS